MISKIMGGLKDNLGNTLQDAASTIGKATSTAANNRKVTGDFTQDYDKLKLAAQQDERAQESDALRKLVVGNYLKGGGSHFKPESSLHLGGQDYNVPNLGFGPSAASPEQVKAGGILSSSMLDRLNPSKNFNPSPLSSYTQPSTLEKVGNAASTALGIGGAISNLINPPEKQPTYSFDPKSGSIISNLVNRFV